MPKDPSLFAQRLRAYRTQTGAHGRMTQEELAARLGLSAEAISKYERSQSFIRGDLEPLLADRLGWSAADIRACRIDWAQRRNDTAYRRLSPQDLAGRFAAKRAAGENPLDVLAWHDFHALPRGFVPDDHIWTELLERFPDQACVLGDDDCSVASWLLMFPDTVLEPAFDARHLREADFKIARMRRPLLPGWYFAYCPGVVVAQGHERAALPLLSAFTRLLADLAAREIFLSRIGAIAVNDQGAGLCADLAMTCLGPHRDFPAFSIWELAASRIAMGILGRRDPSLAAAYGAALP